MKKPTIDISSERKRLDEAFSKGEVSPKEYRRIQQGISNIAVGQSQGYEYTINPETRSFDAKKDSQDARGRIGGVTAFNPISGRKTSKAVTFIASNRGTAEPQAQSGPTQNQNPPAGNPPVTNQQSGNQQGGNPPAAALAATATGTGNATPGATASGTGPASGSPSASSPAPSAPATGTQTNTANAPKGNAPAAKPPVAQTAPATQTAETSIVENFPQQSPAPNVQRTSSRFGNLTEAQYLQKMQELDTRLSYISPRTTNRQVSEERRNKTTEYRLLYNDYVQRFGRKPEGMPRYEFDSSDGYRIRREDTRGIAPYLPQGPYPVTGAPNTRRTSAGRPQTPMPTSVTDEIKARMFSPSNNMQPQNFRMIRPDGNGGWRFYRKGGMIPKFNGGVNRINELGQLAENTANTVNNAVWALGPGKFGVGKPQNFNVFSAPSAPVPAQAQTTGTGTPPPAKKGMFGFLDGQNGVFRQNRTSNRDIDSLINTGLGVFGAASGLTNRAPHVPRSERANFRIRPAMGDPDTLQRNLNSAEGTYRTTVRSLRDNVGADATTYVRGVLGAGANRDSARGQAFMADSAIRIQDRQREDYQKLMEDQINNQLANQDIQNRFNWNAQRWAQRAQGAQGMLNSALNFGVQKRANEYNNRIAERNAMREVGMLEAVLRRGEIDKFVRENGGRQPTDAEIEERMRRLIPQKPSLFV